MTTPSSVSSTSPSGAVRSSFDSLVGPPLPTTGAPASDDLASPRTWARLYRARLFTSDVLIIAASVILAVIFRFGVASSASVYLFGFPVDYWLVGAAIAVAWIAVIGAYRTRDARVVGIGPAEYKRIVSSSLLTFGLLAIVFFVFKVDVARGFFIISFPLGLGGLTLSRWLWRQWLTRQRKFGHYLTSAIVVGRARDVEYVVRQIRKKSGAAYDIVGIVTKHANESYLSVDGHSIPVIAGLHEVPAAATRYDADVVIVAGQPAGGANYIRTLGWELENTRAELVLASGLTNVAGPRIHMRPVEGLPLMHVELPQFEGGKHILKRAFDVAVAAFALAFLAPLMVIIALMVRRDSTGPVLFRQERVGRNGKMFKMLKFRSMVVTAEQDLQSLLDRNEVAGGILFKLHDDPRVTRIGRVLRKYSLDELPQFWNVLVGDMSLVGPRPPLMREVEKYESHVRRRLFIKPGLTGMWQVNGRSTLSWEESVTLDLYYVENWSLTGDFVILWRTLKAMKSPTGAF